MRSNHPDVLYRFDYGAGLKMTMPQAKKQKKLNRWRGWPDLTIYAPRGGFPALCLEIKRENERIWKKDGSPANEHIEEQAHMGLRLIEAGYKFDFAIGFEESKKLIEEYLELKNEQ